MTNREYFKQLTEDELDQSMTTQVGTELYAVEVYRSSGDDRVDDGQIIIRPARTIEVITLVSPGKWKSHVEYTSPQPYGALIDRQECE